MRIRKRQVPFPLSPLSPVPLSDPHPINRSPGVVQLDDAAATPKSSCTPLPQLGSAAAPSRLDRPQPSDHPLPPIGKRAGDGSDDSSGGTTAGAGGARRRQQNKQDRLDEDGRGQEGQKGNDTGKGGIFGSEISAWVFPPSTSPSNQDGRWCDGEKAIPLKKRRGSFENATENDAANSNKKKKMKTRMKTKMNKKCSVQNDNTEREDEDDDEEEVGETKPDLNVAKKRSRGGALMEGSRCSRVNGRGWRCCQQTLVGYSLCEHHLGKGRLRSMTSVRSRSVAAPKKLHDPLCGASSSSPEKQTKCIADPLGSDTCEDKDEKKPPTIAKKRMKLGMVRARSISSLLGQTNNEISAAENNK